MLLNLSRCTVSSLNLSSEVVIDAYLQAWARGEDSRGAWAAAAANPAERIMLASSGNDAEKKVGLRITVPSRFEANTLVFLRAGHA